jgi:rod shape-determining protein MreD
MSLNTLKSFFLFVFLVLLQVWILSHVHIGGIAIPLAYIYFILKLSSANGRSWVTFWAFILGLTIDIFNNTPGLNALAATFAGFFRYYILNLFSSKEEKNFVPSTGTMGMRAFLHYVSVIILLHHTALFCIEAFSFYTPLLLLLKIICSSALTFLMVFAFEFIGRNTTRE